VTLTSRLHHPRWCLGACRLHGRPFEECRHRELLCSHVVMHRPEQPHLGKEKPKTTYTKPNEGHKICRRPVAAVPCRSSQHCRSFSSSARSSPHQAVKPSNLHPYVFHNHDTSTTNNHARTSRVSTGTGSCVVVDDRPNRMVVTFVHKRATQERVDTLARQATRSLVAAWRPTMNDERRRDVGQQTTTTQQQHRLRSSVNFETFKLSERSANCSGVRKKGTVLGFRFDRRRHDVAEFALSASRFESQRTNQFLVAVLSEF